VKPVAGQTVVVTGAAAGLGHAIALAFKEAGATVVAVDRDAYGLRTLGVETHVVDLSNTMATSTLMARIAITHPWVDTLIHNAAILDPQPFETLDFEGWTRTVNVGLQAGFLLTKAVWSGMAANGGGCVVYVSSRSGIQGFADESAYCAAKHGLEGLMKSLAMEGEAKGIRVHTVTPGMSMRTPMSERNYTPELKAKWVEPARLAPAFLRLATRAEPELSGQRLSAWELAGEGGG
jgi:3-hydroxybutyrate dehydrogenase